MRSGGKPDDFIVSSELPEIASPSSLEVDLDTLEDVALLESPDRGVNTVKSIPKAANQPCL